MTIEQYQLKQNISNLTQQIEVYEQRMVELQQRGDIQHALNEMLSISLMQLSLNEQMEKILHLVLNIPWLALDQKGCVFLTDEYGDGLKMVAYLNLSESLLRMCDHIQFGQCLCGKAAQRQELIFRNCVDHDHSIRPEGMQPHGHYNVPIISNDKTLGVLNLYVKHGHHQTTLEQEFLSASAKAMASIIERKKIEEQLHRLSYIDDLTGIANRRQFMNHLDNVIEESQEHEREFAVLFIDFDHFKAINDTYGHEYGDQILVDATRRILECLRDTDMVARLGGDEFVVLLEAISIPDKVIEIARKLIQSISQPYGIKDKTLTIGASIGVSLYPQHDTSAEGLLNKADRALYEAKNGRGKAMWFTSDTR